MKENFRNATRLVVLNEKNELLIVHMWKVWGIPWGGIDFWESIIEALERESVEELWIKADADKLIFIQDYTDTRKGKYTHFFEYFWTVKNNDDFKNVLNTYKDSSHAFELLDIKWSKIEDLPEKFMPKAFPKILKKYLENKENFGCEYVSGMSK